MNEYELIFITGYDAVKQAPLFATVQISIYDAGEGDEPNETIANIRRMMEWIFVSYRNITTDGTVRHLYLK